MPRRLLINSVANMRELGGYTTQHGDETQYGRFIRSDVPERLTAEDVQTLLRYGVTDVVDLRTQDELRKVPSALAKVSGINYQHISFTDDPGIIGNIDFCPLKHYVPMLQGENRVRQIMSALAQSTGAVIFNCSAGKDRTGLIAVMLLLNAGVPRVDVVADYQVTHTYIKHILHKKINNVNRDFYLTRTEPEWLEPALQYIDERGGIVGYLAGIGVSDSDIAKLKDKLVNK